ncbi:MAG: HAMP domain-containing histidine kinase [Deltaproteobacteria bacterium]|nr:HAMP domain-containing histidine kinase [Deltaproteobacteria bacterium]
MLGSSLISGFIIYKLRDFSVETNRILILENRIQEYSRKLTDALLSQVRYEKKYFLLKDSLLYDQFLLAKGEFLQNLMEARALPIGPQEKTLLGEIALQHEQHEALVEKGLRSKPRLFRSELDSLNKEKEETVNAIIRHLEALKEISQQNNLRRFRELGEAQEASLQFIIYIGAAALGLIVMISWIITRSITRPIGLLVDKTREMGEGRYPGDLKIKSPPEVARLNRAFNDMCDRLNKIDKMKSDFFSIMSHELRTPLTSIREGTNLLLEGVGGDLKEKQKKLLGIISEESNRLIELVNSLLDLAKMEAGMMPFHFSRMDFSPVITITAQLMEPLLASKKISLKLDYPDTGPAVRVDNERIMQVIKNLLANAIRFSLEGGTIQVSLKNRGGFLEIAVHDQGPGIPPDQLKHIFEKFRQVELPGGLSSKGTGLGLAIVKQIITAHGGKVWAESEIGKGSSFFFTLPLD